MRKLMLLSDARNGDRDCRTVAPQPHAQSFNAHRTADARLTLTTNAECASALVITSGADSRSRLPAFDEFC